MINRTQFLLARHKFGGGGERSGIRIIKLEKKAFFSFLHCLCLENTGFFDLLLLFRPFGGQ